MPQKNQIIPKHVLKDIINLADQCSKLRVNVMKNVFWISLFGFLWTTIQRISFHYKEIQNCIILLVSSNICYKWSSWFKLSLCNINNIILNGFLSKLWGYISDKGSIYDWTLFLIYVWNLALEAIWVQSTLYKV